MPFPYFKTNQPYSLLFYVPLGVLVWLPHILQSTDPQPFVTFSYSLVPQAWFIPQPWAAWAGCALTLLQAIWFDRILNRSAILGRETHMHGAIYILLMGWILPQGAVNDQMISILFLLSAIDIWWKQSEQRPEITRSLDASVRIGMATLIYLPHATFILPGWAVLILFRSFSWRDNFFVLLGFGIPVLIAYSVLFLMHQNDFYHHAAVQVPLPDDTFHHSWYAAMGSLFLIAIVQYMMATPSNVIRIRKMRRLPLMILTLSVCISAGVYLITEGIFPCMAAVLPLSVYVSSFITFSRIQWFAWLMLYAAWAAFILVRLPHLFQ